MIAQDNGGPAFPVVSDGRTHGGHDGMTLRDWLAGMALKGILCDTTSSPEVDASYAYKLADAMLAARKEGV